MGTSNVLNANSAGVVSYNGTGTFTGNPVTNHGVVVGGSGNTVSTISVGSAASVLLGNAAANPSWSTYAMPTTVTSGGVLYTGTSNNTVGVFYMDPYALLVSDVNGNMTNDLQAGANGTILTVIASAPAFTTATYPSTTTVNRLLYSSSTNVVGQITTVNNGVLITSNTGVPSWLADGTTGQVLTATTGAPPSWAAATGGITTINGDAGSVTGATVTISGGTTGLTTSCAATTLSIVGTLKLVNGGTNAALTADLGGVVYSTASALAILAHTATANQVLLSGPSAAPTWSVAQYPSTVAVNTLLYGSSSNVVSTLATSASAVLTTVASVPTWAAELSLALGGTNAALTASNGGIFYSTASAGAILAGTATASKVLLSGASTTPSWSTSTYPSAATSAGSVVLSDGTNFVESTATYPATTTINQVLYSSSNNAVAGITAGANGVLISSATNVPSWLADGTTGQVLTATTGAPPSWAAAAGGGGLTWTDNSGTFTAVKSNGYFITTTSTPTMPSTPSEGDSVAFIIDTTNICTITGNTGQKLRIGTSISGAAGTCASNFRGDSVTFIYRSTGTTWMATQSIGTWTVT